MFKTRSMFTTRTPLAVAALIGVSLLSPATADAATTVNDGLLHNLNPFLNTSHIESSYELSMKFGIPANPGPA